MHKREVNEDKIGFELNVDPSRYALLYTGEEGFCILVIVGSFVFRGEDFIIAYDDTENLWSEDELEHYAAIPDQGEVENNRTFYGKSLQNADGEADSASGELLFLHLQRDKEDQSITVENVSERSYAVLRDYFLENFLNEEKTALNKEYAEAHKSPLEDELVEISALIMKDLEEAYASEESENIEVEKVDGAEKAVEIYSVYGHDQLRQTVLADFLTEYDLPGNDDSFLSHLDPEDIKKINAINAYGDVSAFKINADFADNDEILAELEERSERE